MRQLNNVEFYQEVLEDPSKTILKLIQTTLLEAANLGYISEATYKSLCKQEYRIPIFYVLPKIHKPGFPPPGRPIISGCDSFLDPLSKYLDFFFSLWWHKPLFIWGIPKTLSRRLKGLFFRKMLSSLCLTFQLFIQIYLTLKHIELLPHF